MIYFFHDLMFSTFHYMLFSRAIAVHKVQLLL